MSEKQNKTRSFAGTAVLMGIIILAAKVLGLVRDSLVAGKYGTSMEAIAYETASRLPVTVFDLVIGGVVTTAFIPVYNSLLVKKGKAEALDFARSYVNLILVITLAIAVLGIAFASPLVTFMAPELDEATHTLAVRLTRILFPMIIFTGLAFSFVGYLQSMGEYNIPALISLLSNGIMVGYLLTLDSFCGITGLAVAMLLGWAAQALVQIPSLRRLGFSWKLRTPLHTEPVRRAIRNALPILLSTWTTPVCTLINTRLASGIEDGRGITALGYANRLYTILVGLFSFVATNLLFPYFSRAAVTGEKEETDRLMRISVRTLVYIIAPITVGIVLLAEPFTALVYEKGSFTADDTALTAQALAAFALSMVFLAVNEVLIKSFFAAEETKIPMISALIAMTVNVGVLTVLSGVCADRVTVGLIALLSGGATLLNMTINAVRAHRRGMMRLRKADWIDLAKIAAAALLMAPAVWFAAGRLTSDFAAVAVGAVVGMLVYFPLTLLFRCECITGIVNALRKRH
ncbi:MAG: murein biosynthesis integral membrane protein MurJ [Clostridia bacterium]|nr:murein biosynthesis integral membrane protein MurJ [Clostridia bacterium]